MNIWRADSWRRTHYSIIYVFSFGVCWGSLALLIANGAKYVSMLSWNLFGLERV